MRRGIVLLALLIALSMAGCHKARTITNFGLKPGMTREDVEDEMGSPDKEGGHWISYKMADGSELRLIFVEGDKGATRTLTSADLFTGSGPSLTVTNVFRVEPTTRPASNPASAPTTAP